MKGKSLFIKKALVRIIIMILLGACLNGQAAEQGRRNHAGHSDDLLVLLQHKLALQKLQKKQKLGGATSTLSSQAKHFQQVMPILRNYMATPRIYYLTAEMYRDSLENRAAMLSDFSALLIQYQNQLVSIP